MEKTIEKIIERLKDFEPTQNDKRQIIKWLGELIQLRKQCEVPQRDVELQRGILVMRNEKCGKLAKMMQEVLGQEDKFKVGDIVWVEDDDGKRVKRVFWYFCGGEDCNGFPYVCFNPDDSSRGECFDKAELCVARAEL